MPTWKFPPDGMQFSLETKSSGNYRVIRIIDEDEDTITIEFETFLCLVTCQLLKDDIIAVSFRSRPLADSLERMVRS